MSDDGRLGQFDREAVRLHVAALRATAGAIEELELDALADEIDRTALLDDVRATIARLEEDRPTTRDPAFWVDHLARVLSSAFLPSDPAAPVGPRADAVTHRIAAIPQFLESARATLLRPPLLLVDAALVELGSVGELLVHAAAAFGAAAPAGPDAVNASVAEALRALAQFGHWLRSEVEPETGLAGAVLGDARFERRINHRYAVREGPTKLWRYALSLLDETEAALNAEAHAVNPGATWRDVLAHLEQETVPALAAMNAELERARAWLSERGVPVGPGPSVVVAPPFLRGLRSSATYLPAGPPGSGEAQLVLPADRMSRTALPALAAAVLAGRHLQESIARELPSEVRRRLRAPIALEGWALYAEQWMGELGFYRDAGARLVRLTRLLRAAGRLAVDGGIHARGMTVADAIALLTDRAGLTRDAAEAELRWILGHPTDGSAAALGRREILTLRAAAAPAATSRPWIASIARCSSSARCRRDSPDGGWDSRDD